MGTSEGKYHNQVDWIPALSAVYDSGTEHVNMQSAGTPLPSFLHFDQEGKLIPEASVVLYSRASRHSNPSSHQAHHTTSTDLLDSCPFFPSQGAVTNETSNEKLPLNSVQTIARQVSARSTL